MAGLEPILPTREIVGLEGKKNGFRNGIAKNGSAKNGIATIFPKENMNTPLSPPYIVAPSFEMRWPSLNGSPLQPPPAFHLTPHKQLEHADHIEELFEESDESPPYLPTHIKPSAPSLSSGEEVVEKSV